jgi:hypothetical protein
MVATARALIITAITIALLLSSRPMNATSYPTGQLAPRFNQAIIQVHKAELAGATSGEVAGLVALLNEALQLDEQALQLTKPEDSQEQIRLLSQVDEIIGRAQIEAASLEVIATRRTLTNNVLAYVSGGLAAILATIAFACGLFVWRKYRIKRTFQMKVVPK